jgi:hypothetical protein
MAERLLDLVRSDISSGRVSWKEARERLLQLYEVYEAEGQTDELDAVADVLDSFYGWAPSRAAV